MLLSLQWGSTHHGCVVVIPTPEQYVERDRDTGEDIKNQISVWSTLDDSESVRMYTDTAGLGSQVHVRQITLNPQGCRARGVLNAARESQAGHGGVLEAFPEWFLPPGIRFAVVL